MDPTKKQVVLLLVQIFRAVNLALLKIHALIASYPKRGELATMPQLIIYPTLFPQLCIHSLICLIAILVHCQHTEQVVSALSWTEILEYCPLK